MNSKRAVWPIVLAGWLAVTLIDGGGSLYSRATGTPYGWFAIASLINYAVLGIVAAKRGSLGSAAIVGFCVALFDVTIGLWMAWVIGPGRIPLSTTSEKATAFLTLMFFLSFDTALALIAGAIWRKMH